MIRKSNNALVPSAPIGMRISIMKGTSTVPVYVETQTTNTNANGLVTIEIGSGSVVSGVFSSINWGDGIYFIKTETDPLGGTAYSITSISQLLSVPYAFHSKTAESLAVPFSETDPLFSASPAYSISSSNIVNWNSAYGWGNHANAGYLTSYTESDPVWSIASLNYYTKNNMQTSGSALMHFNNITNKPTTISGYGITDAMNTSSPANSISLINIANWNLAYSWGNHTSAGYLTHYTETDPIWTAAASNYYTKTNMQTSGAAQMHFNNITNKPNTLAGYGIVNAMNITHVANGITSTNIANWNNAYNWGNHALAGYLTSYTETDPVWNAASANYYSKNNMQTSGMSLMHFNNITNKPVTLAGYGIVDAMNISHVANSITSSDISNWDNAYTWGNHASAGYLTSYTETDPIWNAASVNYYNKIDMQTSGASLLHFNNLTNKPTTLLGYGITDAMNTSHPANAISSANISNWNSAYGWGNHAGLYRPVSWVPSWTEVIDKPNFASVATSGSYTDLSNQPTIINSQWITSGHEIYYNDGNVGIGTVTPTSLLNVKGNGTNLARFESTGDNLSYIDVINTNSGNSAGNSIRLITKDAANSAETSVDIVKYRTGAFEINNNETSANAFTAFLQSGEERMRITSAGYIGIGTATPVEKFHVAGSNGLFAKFLNSADNTGEGIAIGSAANLGRISTNGATTAMGFEINASEKMRIDATGKVGIGTTTPGVKFHVAGSNGLFVQFLNSASTTGEGIAIGSGANLGRISTNGASTAMGFEINASEKMRIDATGKVGIGTSSPAASLQVVGGILARGGAPGVNGVNNNGYAFTGNGGDNDAGMYSSADGQLEFYGNSLERVRIATNGNVGIGTIAPGYKLEVTGDIKFNNGNALRSTNGDWLIGADAGGSYIGIGSATTAKDVKLFSSSATPYVTMLGTNGNVGIGTSAPAEKLQVVGSILIPDDISVGSLKIGSLGSYLGRQSSDGSTVLNAAEANIIFKNAATETVRITSAGYVGIGTNTPGRLLSLSGVQSVISLNNTGTTTWTGLDINAKNGAYKTAVGLEDATGKFIIDMAQDGANDVTVLQNGNVGVGIAVPDQKLDVNGVIETNAGVKYPDGVTQVVAANVNNLVPIGAVLSWWKGSGATPALPAGFVECNGQTLNDAASPLNGLVIPNLNGQAATVVGNSTGAGGFVGSNSTTLSTAQLPAHNHTASSGAAGAFTPSGSIGGGGSHSHSINDPGHSHSLSWHDNGGWNHGSINAGQTDRGVNVWTMTNGAATGISINGVGDHGHGLYMNAVGNHAHSVTVDNTGSGTAVDNMQRSCQMTFIMRVR